MSFKERDTKGPLSIEDIELIEASQLAPIDKHHVRLLGHCLGTFRLISDPSFHGSLPKDDSVMAWLKEAHDLQEEDTFLIALIEQFNLAAMQLEKIASIKGISPLELTISDLLSSMDRLADDL